MKLKDLKIGNKYEMIFRERLIKEIGENNGDGDKKFIKEKFSFQNEPDINYFMNSKLNSYSSYCIEKDISFKKDGRCEFYFNDNHHFIINVDLVENI